MNRRKFVYQTSGLALAAITAPAFAKFAMPKDKMDRLAMGTLLWRSQFRQTKPKGVTEIKDELTIMDLPQHHREKFGIKKLEFWSENIESFDEAYLTAVKGKIKSAGCELLDVQFDSSPFDHEGYDLANADEEKRKAGVAHVKKWMDGSAFLGSKCVRVNPGRPTGTVEQSIKSFQELLPYAKSKGLIIITANHFGIETDADKHVAIVKGVPGIYTEPDFGNYNGAPNMYESLAKIIPYAYIVSAKVVDFTKNADGKLEHTSYDFDKCVQLAESLGFKGTYMVAQWSGKWPAANITNDEIANWTIEHLKANIKA
ncbi:TIM barrel protein [Mucilaginibacter sp.]|uniref:sugar phosphate isomerase/epimerase family protein n=1 Tax=Mucilaginibacter sp. TaxID=1882438 RepID=UPI0026043D99|nr:TIM barrel protein [Mucilaginibacter sp.]MDB5032164.1 Sugar phosphate isomerase/epimerase [Mucilaginibacter sp.]